MKIFDILLNTGGSVIISGRLNLEGTSIGLNYDPVPNSWSSLNNNEQLCISTEYMNVLKNLNLEFKDPCNSPSTLCKKFCRNSELLKRHVRNSSSLQKLMKYMNHPPTFKPMQTWMVPFCNQGKRNQDYQYQDYFNKF